MTQASPTPGPLRRVPVQGRSLARVNRMLDACAELVDEVGYDGLTTTLLAERAGVAIGSVYQFFPDKRAVVQALSIRNVDAYIERVSARVAHSGMAKWWDVVDAAIDEYVEMHRRVPGFRVLHFGAASTRLTLDSERDVTEIVVSHLGDLLVADFAATDGHRLRFSLMVGVQMADALIRLAFRRDPRGDEMIIAETKELIREYLYRQIG